MRAKNDILESGNRSSQASDDFRDLISESGRGCSQNLARLVEGGKVIGPAVEEDMRKNKSGIQKDLRIPLLFW